MTKWRKVCDENETKKKRKRYRPIPGENEYGISPAVSCSRLWLVDIVFVSFSSQTFRHFVIGRGQRSWSVHSRWCHIPLTICIFTFSHKQDCVSLSTSEAENTTQTYAFKEGMYFINLLQSEMSIHITPAQTHIDSIGAAHMAEQAVTKRRTKCISSSYHYARK